ncbi:MAG TPA: peroxiredoxin-like family protein [Acetobacteraceae bacterium]|jgi:peroxiredoxin
MTSLASQLDAFLDGLIARMDPATLALWQACEAERVAMAAKTARIGQGDIAPDFTLPDQNGVQVSLSGQLAKGPVVLGFYRGGWCPFCTLTLRAVDRISGELARHGATLLMISPQTQCESAATARRNFLSFSVLSDAGNAVARRYGLVWKAQPKTRALLERLGHDLSRINGTAEWDLPMPAGYVIAPDGRVVLAHADPLVYRRMEPAAALAALREDALHPLREGALHSSG